MLPVIVAGGVIHPLTASASGSTRMIASSGTVVFTGTAQGTDGYQNPEFRAQKSDSGPSPFKGQIADRRGSAEGSGGGGNESDGAAGPNTHLRNSFNGLYHRQQRLANGGNQFSLEPPDQGLCVGKGSVMEIINDVTRVYDKAGSPRSGVEDLNTFYGYPAAIHRAPPRAFGPFITDPNCLFDVATERWFAVVLTIDVNPPDGAFTGPNHLDIAVSTSSDPTGAWTIYRVPAQDDGTQGTPDHGCSASADKNGNPIGHGPCFGDFPHIGANAHGFYVTTNEYSFFGPEFHAAQIYAFSKDALVSGAASVAVTQFDTIGLDAGRPGFTIKPATAPTGEQDNGSSNAELFMSSNAADEVTVPDFTHPGPGTSTELLVWALTNTDSLNEDSPALGLTHTVLDVNRYAVPPSSDQKAGDVPLADCLNDVSPTGCGASLLGVPDPFAPEVEAALDSSDTRMLTVAQASGRLWGALDTALTVSGVNKAGIEWFIVKPSLQDGALSAQLDRQGYLGLADNNVTYPAIGVTREGRGVMGFTVMGADFYPSAGYAGIDRSGVGEVKIAAEGLGPSDGFSGYKAFGNPPGTTRPRWGDYGAAVPDGNSVWIASEYIGQTCDLAAFTSAPFGSCGGTRTVLANWYTRISQVEVH
jgi:hypothetical protein